MGLPRVSIIWLNHNSMEVIGLVRKSLEALGELDYPDYEVIVVDNGSTDGSFEIIKNVVGRFRVRAKLVRIERNLGFTGWVNAGYRARDPGSRYVALVNNDLVVEPNSLLKLVECAEGLEGVGAVQGVILDPRAGWIDSAGYMLTELLVSYPLYYQREPSALNKAVHVTYVDGAYSLLRVESVRRATGWDDRIFYDEAFAYLDDSLLGIQLWNAGYRSVACPFIAGHHRRSSTFGQNKPFATYLNARGWISLNEVTNSAYKPLIRRLAAWGGLLLTLSSALTPRSTSRRYWWARRRLREYFIALEKGFFRRCTPREKLMKTMRRPLDLYRAPVIKVPFYQALIQLSTGFGLYYFRKTFEEYIPEAAE